MEGIGGGINREELIEVHGREVGGKGKMDEDTVTPVGGPKYQWVVLSTNVWS